MEEVLTVGLLIATLMSRIFDLIYTSCLFTETNLNNNNNKAARAGFMIPSSWLLEKRGLMEQVDVKEKKKAAGMDLLEIYGLG